MLTIGERIKKVRRALDLTQAEFASRIGSVQNTVTGYESGRRNPSAPVISLICREFRVNEEWLRSGSGEMFVADPTLELDALAERYRLRHKDYVLVEKLVNLGERERDAIFDIMVEIVTAASAAGADPDAYVFPKSSDTGEGAPEALHAELDRQYGIEKVAEDKSEVS